MNYKLSDLLRSVCSDLLTLLCSPENGMDDHRGQAERSGVRF